MVPLDFSKLLSPAQRQRLLSVRREMERLYGVPDRWLAEELLRLARRAREEHPDELGEADGITYDNNFVWQVVPEIARRLGCGNVAANEARALKAMSLGDGALREYAGHYLKHCSVNYWLDAGAEKPLAMELLLHEVANGNPVAMALDRLCPAPEKGQDQDDYVARTVREISRRRGFVATAIWSPRLQDWRERASDYER